jgi:peptidoglycan hydrolase-like protein with peptidoglycan-binding domain
MSPSPSIPRSKRQTTAAAALTAAALATLAFGCAAAAAQARGQRGADAGIPGSTVGTPTTRGGAGPAAGVLRWGSGHATPGRSDAVRQLQRNLRRLGERPGPIGAMPTAGVLRWGVGYATLGGSGAVRQLQRDLHRLGERLGPIDGLYGSLTQAAVERFQRTRGLTVDGVVGLQTERSLVRRLVVRVARLDARRSMSPATVPIERSAFRVRDDSGSPATEPTPGTPPLERSSDGLSPAWAALIAGLAIALLMTALWAVSSRRRQARAGGHAGARVNAGLAFACLLAVLAIGGSGGALFASRVAPGAHTEATGEPLVKAPCGELAARRLRENSLATPRPPLNPERLGWERSAPVPDLRPLKQLDNPQLR